MVQEPGCLQELPEAVEQAQGQQQAYHAQGQDQQEAHPHRQVQGQQVDQVDQVDQVQEGAPS